MFECDSIAYSRLLIGWFIGLSPILCKNYRISIKLFTRKRTRTRQTPLNDGMDVVGFFFQISISVIIRLCLITVMTFIQLILSINEPKLESATGKLQLYVLTRLLLLDGGVCSCCFH